jgi:phosphinothricin acetyltransferase
VRVIDGSGEFFPRREVRPIAEDVERKITMNISTLKDQRPCRVSCLREAGERDFHLLARLYLLAWEHGCTAVEIAAKVEEIRPRIEEATRSGGAVLLAVRGGQPVGCAQLRRDRERLERFWWEGVAVHPDARGTGVARGLFHQAVRFARDEGSRVLRSETHEDNVPSIRMHERLGFRKVGVFESPFDGDRKIAFALDVGEKLHG